MNPGLVSQYVYTHPTDENGDIFVKCLEPLAILLRRVIFEVATLTERDEIVAEIATKKTLNQNSLM